MRNIFSDIQNSYSRYLEKKLFYISRNTYVFQISKIVFLDIKNNYSRYRKINIYFGYQKVLFWISEIVILDISTSCFGYHK